MGKEIEIAGISAELDVEIPAEFQQAAENAARRKVLAAENLEENKRRILRDAKEMLYTHQERVDITEEIIELGLQDEIRRMSLEADMYWKIANKMFDRD